MRRYLNPSMGVLWVGLGVLFLHHGNYWSAHWASRWAILVIAFSLWISFVMSRRESFSLGLTTAFLLLSATSVGVWPQNRYLHNSDLFTLLAIEKNALYAYLVILICVIGFIGFRKQHAKGAYTFLALVPVLCIGNTLLHYPVAATDGLYAGNPSMNGCLIAATLPFLFGLPYGILALPFAVFTLYLTKTSIPLGVLGVSLGASILAVSRPSFRTVMKIGGVLGGLLLAGILSLGSADLWDNNGRFDVWREILHWNQKNGNFLFGNGLGSAQILIPIIQASDHPTAKGIEFFLWLHNDWLQIFFEAGFIGLCLVVWVWVQLFRKSYRNPALFASFCAFSAMALFNYPLRLPIHSFCLFLIICLIWRERT